MIVNKEEIDHRLSLIIEKLHQLINDDNDLVLDGV